MFEVMSDFSKFICFIISMNIGVSSYFVYGESVSSLL